MSVYFGGSRNLKSHPTLAQVVQATIMPGRHVHVGCQTGADNLVLHAALEARPHYLTVFSVAACAGSAPPWVQHAAKTARAVVWFGSGRLHIPYKARLLLRSVAAFQGCSAAVFFEPGPGSLAVAREAHKAGIPVFVFSETMPAPIPATPGAWLPAQFVGFSCWQFNPAQSPLF